MNPIGVILRMKRLAQHPPSWRRVVLGLCAIGAVLAIAAAEAMGLWPDGMTAARARPPGLN